MSEKRGSVAGLVMLRIALDTNILISGLFFNGNERKLLIAGLTGRYILVLSKDIIEETYAIVERKFTGSENLDHAMAFLSDLISASEFHNEGNEGNIENAKFYIRDPDDVVHAAFILAAEPDIFLSGDGDFLEHPSIGQTRILNTKDTLRDLEMS